MNNLQFVKSKVIEAVPEIMELKLGCKILWRTFVWSFVGKNYAGNFILYSDFGSQTKVISEKMMDFEIGCKNLGRPIRLADVLITAIPKSGSLNFLIQDGHAEEILKSWNLSKDSLDDQSEETINFLANLL